MNTPTTEALISLEDLQRDLDGRELPGGETTIEPYESALADHALLAPDQSADAAHPVWSVMLALRGMGISVDELCALAAKREQDTLMIGDCTLTLLSAIPVGRRLRTSAVVGPIARKESRSGAVLDFVPVRVAILDSLSGQELAVVTNGYVIKRGA